MAIAKINKIEVIGLSEQRDAFLHLLQLLGIVQMIAASDSDFNPVQAIVSDAEILEIEEATSFIASFQEQSNIFKGMVALKPVIHKEQLKEIINDFDYRQMLKELADLRSHLKNLDHHQERLQQEYLLLTPWKKLSIPLDQLHPTISCGVLLGSIRSSEFPVLLEDLEKENLSFFCEVIQQDKVHSYVNIFYLQEEFERVEAILKNRHFNFTTLGRHSGTAQQRLLEISREIMVLDDQIQDAKIKIAQLAKGKFKLMVVYDYLSNIQKRQGADKNLGHRQFTFSLAGWIKQRDIKILEKESANKFKDLAIFICEPSPDAEVPVDLENPRLIQPFEFITKIYGFPKYSEVDPTPYLAPFFFLYFGFCVSDVGYGFILALISWWVLKKFKMGPQGSKFFRLFFYCGISTILIGALTGGWFGNLFDLMAEGNKVFLPLKRFKDSLIILDPMKEPTKLLGIALSFGIIQVWFGNIIAAIGNIKNKRYLDIWYDQVTMLVFLFGLTGLGLIFLKLLDNSHAGIFRISALLGAVSLIATQGRSEKGWGSKLFYGIYNLYNALSGYLSDILSYSRLWALGLVTGVMASTINLISIQFSQIFTSIVPFLSKVAFIKVLLSSLILIVIFVGGHSVSFLMNLLGAFVHPVRLQFVEFFSKFFKTSGRAFKPFKVETKYINIQ